MAKIVKTDRSPYDQRLGQTFKGEETTGGVRIVVDEKGNQAILGLGETLRTQYHSGSPATKLMTLRDAQLMAVLRLDEKDWLPPQLLELLMETRALLGDMATQALNPLVDYASHPGRPGSRRDSHWDTDARRCLAAAARAHLKLARLRGDTENKPTWKNSCQAVFDFVDEKLKELGVGPLKKRLPGGWRKDTPERREQKKIPATGGERIEGWAESFKKKKDQQYQRFLNDLENLDAPEHVEEFFLHMVYGALNRLRTGWSGVAEN